MNELSAVSGNESKEELIYHAIRNRILKNHVQAGEMISERDLSEEFNTSRTPVRDALKRLEYDGLVEILPRKGVFVKVISFDTIFDIYEVRLGLDAVAARLCAIRKTDTIIKELEQCMRFYIEADRENNISLAAKYNMQFHCIVARGSRNALLNNYENLLINQCNAHIQLNEINLNHQNQSIESHEQILEHIIDGNALEAERIAHDHIIDGITFLTSVRNQYYAIE